MGELSRVIGIAGEQIIISSFLKMVGWNPAMSGLDIKCIQKKHNKNSHGVDGFMSYECPLSLYTQENVYISAKYESKVRHTKSNILKYVNDLVSVGECFRFSERYKEITSNQDFKINKKNHSHVLFCLNHDAEDNASVAKEFKSIYNDIVGDTDGVYLIDNQRFKFIYSCLNSVKSQSSEPGSTYEFCYHQTGVNESYEGLAKFSGKILPVQFINSPVIPVKLKKGKINTLLLYVRENFDREVFKRMIGLAQSLTSGWGNKVIIYFPDYQFKEHRLDRDSILSSLKDRDFASIVQLSTYEHTFKVLEEEPGNEFVENYTLNTEQINVDSLLPFGERMRQLISQSYIDKRDLHTIIKRRAIIVKKSWGKHELVSIFRKIILSPTEFEYLRQRQFAKEYAEKRTKREIRAVHDDIVSLISEDKIPINEIVNRIGNGCVLINSSLTRKGGESVYSYQVQKQDISKDWSNISSIYKGEIIFRDAVSYLDGYKNSVSMIYDSVDTRIINKNIFDAVLSQLKVEGAAQELPPIIMYASELNDENRNKFLLNITEINSKDSAIILFKDVLSVDTVFSSNGSEAIPDDLVEYQNRVRQSSFEGNNIHQLKYLKNDNYKRFFVIKEVIAEFIFNINNEKGIFKVIYGYPTYRGDGEGKSEFEFKLVGIMLEKDENIPRKIYQEIEATLKDEFDRIISLRYSDVEKKFGTQANFLDALK